MTTDPRTRTTPTVPLAWDDLATLGAELGEGVFLATVQADGRPHVAWVMPGWRDGSLWISTFRDSQKGHNLVDGAPVALHWPERPDALMFARGHARVLTDRAEIEATWAAGVLPYDPSMFFSGADDPQLRFVELLLDHVSVSTLNPTVPVRRWARDA